MSSKYLIYGLVDPRNGQLRYVGKSCKGLYRPKSHWTPSSLRIQPFTPKNNWIKQVLADNALPSVIVIQEFPDSSVLSDAERHWIRYFRHMGCPLTNLTDGGEGGHGPSTPETRLKISQALKGKPKSIQHREASARARKGKPAWAATHAATIKNQCPVEDSLGRVFPSLKEAAAVLGIHRSSISKVLSGVYKTAGGLRFYWRD